MGVDVGIEPRLYINETPFNISVTSYSFNMADSIYQVFPDMELTIADTTGLAIELGAFTRGIPVKIILGIEDDLLETVFVVNNRDTVNPLMSSVMGGTLKVHCVHESYMKDRECISAGYKKKKASDIAKELFPDIEVEDTSAKLAILQSDEPYTYIQEILRDIADSSTNSCFVFFRDLSGVLHFKSVNFLLEQSPVGKLSLMQDNGEKTIKNKMNVFLPFDEKLTDTFHAYSAQGTFLDNLKYKNKNATVVDAISQFLPVIADNVKDNWIWFGRQFNPDMDYGSANNGLLANSMRKGFLTDKAFTIIPFDNKMVCGKVVDVEVFLQDENQAPVISEAYSGKWLIESSTHIWNGAENIASTHLILSRNSLKPVSDSILETKGYKGKK